MPAATGTGTSTLLVVPPLALPEVRAQVVQSFEMLSEGDQTFVLDTFDETSMGGRRKLMRYGIGGAVGLVVGALIVKAIR